MKKIADYLVMTGYTKNPKMYAEHPEANAIRLAIEEYAEKYKDELKDALLVNVPNYLRIGCGTMFYAGLQLAPISQNSDSWPTYQAKMRENLLKENRRILKEHGYDFEREYAGRPNEMKKAIETFDRITGSEIFPRLPLFSDGCKDIGASKDDVSPGYEGLLFNLEISSIEHAFENEIDKSYFNDINRLKNATTGTWGISGIFKDNFDNSLIDFGTLGLKLDEKEVTELLLNIKQEYGLYDKDGKPAIRTDLPVQLPDEEVKKGAMDILEYFLTSNAIERQRKPKKIGELYEAIRGLYSVCTDKECLAYYEPKVEVVNGKYQVSGPIFDFLYKSSPKELLEIPASKLNALVYEAKKYQAYNNPKVLKDDLTHRMATREESQRHIELIKRLSPEKIYTPKTNDKNKIM